MTDAQARLLSEVEAFLREQRMADSAFGRLAMNDWKFVGRLRNGVNMTTETMDKASKFMERERRRTATDNSSGAPSTGAAP